MEYVSVLLLLETLKIFVLIVARCPAICMSLLVAFYLATNKWHTCVAHPGSKLFLFCGFKSVLQFYMQDDFFVVKNFSEFLGFPSL